MLKFVKNTFERIFPLENTNEIKSKKCKKFHWSISVEKTLKFTAQLLLEDVLFKDLSVLWC